MRRVVITLAALAALATVAACSSTGPSASRTASGTTTSDPQGSQGSATTTLDRPELEDVDTVEYAPGLAADLYVPTAPTTKPVIVWVHGGGFTGGDRTQLRSVATALAERGYPGMAIQYHLSAGGPWFPATSLDDPALAVAAAQAVDDTGEAVAWLGSPEAERRGLSGRPIVVAGYSAGAITAATAAADLVPGLVGAVSIAGSVLDPSMLGPSTPPLLFVHGDADEVVPIGLARASCDAAHAQGTRCELDVLAGTGHSLSAADQRDVLATIEGFLERL